MRGTFKTWQSPLQLTRGTWQQNTTRPGERLWDKQQKDNHCRISPFRRYVRKDKPRTLQLLGYWLSAVHVIHLRAIKAAYSPVQKEKEIRHYHGFARRCEIQPQKRNRTLTRLWREMLPKKRTYRCRKPIPESTGKQTVICSQRTKY